jgi:hypothetical protein
MKTSRCLRYFLVPAALGVAVLAPRPALAQSSVQDSAVAQSLYDQARKLTADTKYADACPKFEESQRLDPTPVTEFWLADCYEHVGRTASAWSSFLDLAAAARKNGGPQAEAREKAAKDRATAIQPKLTQLEIDVPAAVRVPGLVVKRDGEAMHDGQWGSPIPVDPGNHTIEASAPGKVTWTKTQDIEGVGQTVTVAVQVLTDAPSGAAVPPAAGAVPAGAPAPEAPPAEEGSSPWKTVGLVTAGVGVVGLGVGTVFGMQALSKNSSANNGHCGGSLGSANNCDSTGVQLRSDAVSSGNISTVFFVVGGVLAAGGAALWFLAPSSHVQAAPAVGDRGTGGVIVRGDF